MRAFLQRCEVRLSTMHRVATALLSGAGILVLLPAVERDSFLQVLRSLLVGPIPVSRGLLAAAVALSIGLALTMLWFVVVELTRFYFHANHIVHPDGEVFTPRFTLTGLRLPDDELGAAVDETYGTSHGSPNNVALLVPSNRRGRERIDRQLAAYPGAIEGDITDITDAARGAGLFELAASRRRPLVEEVVKVEYGIVRHMLRLQVVVLRYVKALLVVVATSLATYVCAAAVNGQATVSAPEQRWIAATMMLWAPLVAVLVTSPVRWLENLLRTEGAAHTAVHHDAELTQVEKIAIRVASVAWACAAIAMVDLLVHHDITTQGRVGCIVALAVSAIVGALVLVAPQRRRSRAN